MKKKVIVAGHICLDITPVFPDGKVKSVEQVLSPGKLIQMGNADVHTGGAVANTGLAMKLLGADVSLMGKVGEDAFGDMILNILDGYDAKEGMIRDKESTTSYSVVLAIPGIDRIFLHHPGANHTFAVSDIDFDKVKEAALFHFGYPTLMESMYNNDGAELVHLMKSVQETGAATSLDLAAVDANSKAGQADWAKILGRTLPYVDFFVPSIEELCFMLDRDKFEELQVRADGGDITDVLDIEQDVKPLAEKCITLGCKVLLLKCGAKGMYLQTAGEEKLRQVSVRTELDVAAWAEKAVFEKSYTAEELQAPVMVGTAEVLLPATELNLVADYLIQMAKKASVPVCVHYDHGLTFERCMEALKLGFTSVMYDCSTVSYEENVERVAEMVKICHAMGVTVEAELGHVGDNAGAGKLENPEDYYTDPDTALDYITRTGADSLAVAVGNAHGDYAFPPKLDFDRIDVISKKVNIPLVLHGGSGLADNDFRQAVQLGVSKVNIFTDIDKAGKAGVEAGIAAGERTMMGLIPYEIDAMKKVVAEKIRLFGSEGKAC